MRTLLLAMTALCFATQASLAQDLAAIENSVGPVQVGQADMIKDIVVNLTVGAARDPAADYAISMAKTFNAHLAGVAFAYEPVLPAIVGVGIPDTVIEEQHEENE